MDNGYVIDGKHYTTLEIYNIRRWLEKKRREDEAREIVAHIREDEATGDDPDFAKWLDDNMDRAVEVIVAQIEQKEDMALYCETPDYDPYAEELADVYFAEKRRNEK